MRIIAGRLGGRIFASPRGRVTHPMSDKVRGALFNALGDITGLTVLDAFAGSGALAYEAVSRGAGSAVLIDSDASAQRTIVENISVLGLKDSVKLIRSPANAWLTTSSPEAGFDIVLCDPPYQDVQLPLLKKLIGKVAPGGTFVLSWPGKTEVPAFDGFRVAAHKSYGDAQLVFYQASLR